MSFLQKLALLAVSLLVSVGLLEAGVRFLGLAPEVGVVARGRFQLSSNPRLVYEPVPDSSYQGEDLQFHVYRGASNRLGYRDYDHEIEKPDGIFRVIVLGDSIAAGLGITRYESTFPALLEELLNRAGHPTEVINFGVSGYYTRQEVETLRERGLRYDPDLVLLAYCLNDRNWNAGPILDVLLAEARRTAAPAHISSAFLQKSALFRVLRYRFFHSRGSVPEAYEGLETDTVPESLGELAELADQHGFRALLAVFPHLTNLSNYGFDEGHDYVRSLSERYGFEYLDLLEPMLECEKEGRLNFDSTHPNARGHRCAARAMGHFILRTYLRPPSTGSR